MIQLLNGARQKTIQLFCKESVCLIGTDSETVDLADSEFVFVSLPNSKNCMFGRIGRPVEDSAPKGRGFGRHRTDSHFLLQSSEKRGEFACVATVSL